MQKKFLYIFNKLVYKEVYNINKYEVKVIIYFFICEISKVLKI